MYAELKLIVCQDCGEQASVRFYKTAIRCNSCAQKLWKKNKAERRSRKRELDPSSHRVLDFKADLKKHYGMTVEEYQTIYDAQKGCCGSCGKPESEHINRLHVDHDHATGQVRGLLCTKCNPGIGYFDDSIEKLEMAIAYLKKFKK